MGSEQFGPFAIDPAWRRRGPTAMPGVVEVPVAPPQPSQAPAPQSQPTPGQPATRADELQHPTPTSERPAQPAPTPAVQPAPWTAKLVAAPTPVPSAPELPPPHVMEALAPVGGQVSNARAAASPKPPKQTIKPVVSEPAPDERPRKGFRVEALVPYLAALVGLVALGGAVYLDQQNQVRFAAISAELSGLHTAVDAAVKQAAAPVPAAQPADNGALEGLMALQKRIAALEEKAKEPPPEPVVTGSVGEANGTATDEDAAGEGADTAALDVPAPLQPKAIATGTTTAPGSIGSTQLADGPTRDCIPIGTRFLVAPGDSYAICRTTETVRVKDVSMEGVLLMSGKLLAAGDVSNLKFGKCALNVLTAEDGYADMKVTCS